jgi:hypothetical protein
VTEPVAPPPPPARRRPDPLLFLLVGVAAGITVAALREPQPGMFVVAATLAIGGVLRLLLRPRDAGSLVVRNRRLDVAVLLGLAVAIAVLAAVTPFPSGRG